jgi:hypothetical protein
LARKDVTPIATNPWTAVRRPLAPPKRASAAAIPIQIREYEAATDNSGIARSRSGDSHAATESNTERS